MDEKVYNEKREQLQKYVPFLQKLIGKMKDKSVPQHYPLLNKMEILYGLITASNKRLSPETLNKCESSLRNLYIKLSDKEISKEDLQLENFTNETNTKNGTSTDPAVVKIKTEPTAIKIKTEPGIIKTEKVDEPEPDIPKTTEPTPTETVSGAAVKKEVEDSNKRKSDMCNVDSSKKTKVADVRVQPTVVLNSKDCNKSTNVEDNNKNVQKSKEPSKEVNPEPEKSHTPKRKKEALSQSQLTDISKKIKVEKVDGKSKSNAKVVILENKEIPKLQEGQAITKEMLGGILSNVLDSSLVKDLVEKIFAKPNEGSKSLKQRVKTEVVEVDRASQIYEIFDDDDVLLIEDDENKESGESRQNSTETTVTTVTEKSSKGIEGVSGIANAQTEPARKAQNVEVVDEIIDLDEEENIVSQPTNPPAPIERAEVEMEITTCVINDSSDPEDSGKIKEVLETVEAKEKKSVEQRKQNKAVKRVSDASEQGKKNKIVRRTSDVSKQEKQSKVVKQTSNASKLENKTIKGASDVSKQEHMGSEKQSESIGKENVEQGKQTTIVRPISAASNVNDEKSEEENQKLGEKTQTVEETNDDNDDNKQIGKVKKLKNNNLKITLKRKKIKDKTKASKEEKRIQKHNANMSAGIDIIKDESKETVDVAGGPEEVEKEPKEIAINGIQVISTDSNENTKLPHVEEAVLYYNQDVGAVEEVVSNEELGDKELVNILEPLVVINDGTENASESYAANEANVTLGPNFECYSGDGWTTEEEEETGTNKVHKKHKSIYKDSALNKKKKKLMPEWPSFGAKKKKKKYNTVVKKINFDLNNFNVAHDILPKKYEIDVTLFKYDFRHLKNNKMNVRDFEILQKQVEQSLPANKLPPKNTDVNMLPDVIQCALCPHTDRFLPSHYVRFHSDSEVLVSRLPPEAVIDLKNNLNNIPEKVNKLQYRMNCQFCRTLLTFTTRAWRSHYMRHTGEYQFKCATCNIHASQTSRFVNHKLYCKNPDIVQIRVWERSMKNVDAFVCDACNYIQMQEESLRKHVKTQHDTPVTYTPVILVNVLGLDSQFCSLVLEPPKKIQFIPNTNRDVHLKNPIYRRQCVLCEYNGPYIVKHYMKMHHDAELFTARLSPDTLDNLMRDTNNVAYKQNNEFLHVHVFQYRCPFCDLHFIFPAKSWIEHLGEHTGECRYQCKLCWRSANKIEDFNQFDKCSHVNISLDEELYKKMRYIQYAFVCAFCNFTQLNKKRVESHLRLQHNFQLENINDKIFEVALLKFEGYDRFSNPFGDANAEMEFNEEIVGTSTPVVVSQIPPSPMNPYNLPNSTTQPNAPRSENVWPYQNGVSLDQYGIVLTDDSLNSSSSSNLPMLSPTENMDMSSADSPPNHMNPSPVKLPPKVGPQNLSATITKPVVQSVPPLYIAPVSSNNAMSPPATIMNTSSSANTSTSNAQVVQYTSTGPVNQVDSFIDLTKVEEESVVVPKQIEHKLPGQCVVRKIKNIGFCKDGTRQFHCLIQGCNFSTSMSYIIRDHITKEHPKTIWDSYCFECKGFTLLKRTYSCVTEYKHMLDMHLISDRADKAKSTFVITQFKDGQLPINRVSNIGYTMNPENKIFLYCLADGCKVKTPHMYTLLDHIDKVHQSVLWDHYCELCNKFVAPKSWALLRKELQHLQEKHTVPLSSPAKLLAESSNIKQQPVAPIVSVQPRLTSNNVTAQPRTLNNSPLTINTRMICNGATSVTTKPTLKVRRLSGDSLSAQKALESARANAKMVNQLPSAFQPSQLKLRLSLEPNKPQSQKFENPAASIPSPSGAASLVIKQILSPNPQEHHKATVQPQQMQNHMPTPDSTMHINSNEHQDANPTVLAINPVKPWAQSLSVKMPEAAQKQMREVCLYALYKCMGNNCTYVTSCIENMRKHLGYHEQAAANLLSSTTQSFYECAYCSVSILNVGRLLEHIKGEHARDLYQCPYCFYRSCDAQNVLTHLKLLHKDKKHLILLCNGEPRTLEAEFSMVMSSLKANVDPLQCMKCRLNFFIIKSYVDHMTQIHGVQTSDGSINCGMCVRVKSSPENLIKHLLTTHKKGYYECVYCDFATNTFDLMAPHLAHVHNSRLPYVCVRKPKNETEVPLPGKQTLSNSTMLTCVVEQIESSRILKCPFRDEELIFVSPMSRNNNYNSSACSTSSPSFQNPMMAQHRLLPPTVEHIKSKAGLQISPIQMMPMNGQAPVSNVAPVRPQAINPNFQLNRQPTSMNMPSAFSHPLANTAPYYRAIYCPNLMQPNTMLPR